MTTYCRPELVRIDSGIMSAYDWRSGKLGLARDKLCSQHEVGNRVPGADMVPVDVAKALLAADKVIAIARGDFRILDLVRNVSQQAKGRKKYETWLAAGKPKQSSSRWDSGIMKDAYIARPGRSMHNAGRAMDVDLSSLNFVGDPDKQLDTLWGIIEPLGWDPIIKRPDEGASEAWHFDFWGPWQGTYDLLGYEQAAMCAVLDLGHVELFDRGVQRAIQAHLHRAGHDVGDVDGWIGSKTMRGLTDSEVHGWDPDPSIKFTDEKLLLKVIALQSAC